MTQPPSQFDEESFEESIDIVEHGAYKNKFETIKKLAKHAGGQILEQALDPFAFPPCPTDPECENCWMCKWCLHMATPIDVRLHLLNIFDQMTDPRKRYPDELWQIMTAISKVHPDDIECLDTIFESYRNCLDRPTEECKEELEAIFRRYAEAQVSCNDQA